MATVYVGKQVGVAGFERIVAIKCCHEHLRLNEAFVAMFLQEARLAARIRHPNVVATLDVSDGVPLYLVMEYVEGDSLWALARKASRSGQRLPVDIALRVMADSLAGLQAAHQCRGPDGLELGLVHCDVSPQNILVGVDGMSRITDFGIARAAEHMTELDEQGVIKGKLRYMAPEQLRGQPLTPRTDVFAAGIVLWELLTGRPLFRRQTDKATIEALLSAPILAPSAVEPSLPRELDAPILRALEREATARFQSAEEFLAALEQLPIAAASSRAVSEYVRENAETLAVDWESGSFRKGGASVVSVLPAPRWPVVASVDVPVDVDEAALDEPSAADPPTRHFEPPPDLLAASSADSVHAVSSADPALAVVRADPTPFDAYRMRRLVVAFVLVLLGCAVGLLVALSATKHALGPAGASVTGTERP
jgi:serine/threonine-protein kinase